MTTHLPDVCVDPSKSCRFLDALKSVSKFDGIHFLPFDNDQSFHHTQHVKSIFILRAACWTQNVFLWMKEKRPVHKRLLVSVCKKNLVLQIERGNL